jgi:hypothetical protein
MESDPICVVRQTPVPLHAPQPSAGDPAVTPGVAADNTVPQPAAPEPKWLALGPTKKDAQTAEIQAANARKALAKADRHPGDPVFGHATPARTNAAAASVYIAVGKAKVAVWHNLNVQGQYLTERQFILELARSELGRLEGDYPTREELDDAFDRLGRAQNDWAESDARLARAGELAVAVASGAPSVKAATAKYPSLGEAEDNFNVALCRLKQDGLGQVKVAAQQLRAEWAVARDDARKGSDPELQQACDVGFTIAEGIVQGVNDPGFVKAWNSR